MKLELDGSVAVVTGAARNIGRAIAVELAHAGARIIVNAVTSAQEAAETVRIIRENGGEAIVHLADVTDPQACEGLAAAAATAFGGVDILVNNAAIRREAAFADLNYKSWREVTSVILDGAFLCAHAMLPYLTHSPAASIINIGGMSAHSGSTGRAHVIAAKAGLAGLTRALACDLGEYAITANCVVPGLIDTKRGHTADLQPEHHRRAKTLLGRRGTTQEIATLVRFLAGPNARYITGQTIHANGGAFLG